MRSSTPSSRPGPDSRAKTSVSRCGPATRRRHHGVERRRESLEVRVVARRDALEKDALDLGRELRQQEGQIVRVLQGIAGEDLGRDGGQLLVRARGEIEEMAEVGVVE